MASRAVSFVGIGEDLRRNLLESAAKKAYGVWAHRVSIDTPWEHLPVAHALAWKEVVEDVQGEPECGECGQVLLCVDCDRSGIYDCPECGETLECPMCGTEEDEDEAAMQSRENPGDDTPATQAHQEGGS